MPVELGAIISAQRPSRARRRPKTLRSIAPRPVDSVLYARDLRALVQRVLIATRSHLFPVLRHLEPQYVRDAFGDELEAAMQSVRSQLGDLDAYAEAKASGMVERMDKAHQRRYFEQIKRVAGVDLAGIVDRERLDDVLHAKTRENVKLIKSVPEQYLDRLHTLVFETTIQGRTTAASLQQSIIALAGVTDKRARFIARDQTAKLQSAIHTERSLSLGLVEYKWRATGGKSGDGRTRKNHREKHGNVYRFDSPPSDTGHPGDDFQCRCRAEPIIPGT